jgi:hypothetical protein
MGQRVYDSQNKEMRRLAIIDGVADLNKEYLKELF